jgi:hypothetical protein
MRARPVVDDVYSPTRKAGLEAGRIQKRTTDGYVIRTMRYLDPKLLGWFGG